MKRRNRYTPEKKVIILRELLENNISVSELSEKYGIHPNDIYNWKKKLFEGATEMKIKYQSGKLSNNYWNNRLNQKNALDEIIKDINHFPTADDFKRLKYTGLLKALLINYGTLREAAVQLMYPIPENKPKNYWRSIDNVIFELDPLVKEYGVVPSTRIIAKKYSMLYYAIKNYHGGIIAVRKEYARRLKNLR